MAELFSWNLQPGEKEKFLPNKISNVYILNTNNGQKRLQKYKVKVQLSPQSSISG